MFLCIDNNSFVYVCSNDLCVAVWAAACINVTGDISKLGGIADCVFVYSKHIITNFSPVMPNNMRGVSLKY